MDEHNYTKTKERPFKKSASNNICSVPQCSSRYSDGVSLHKFPNDAETRKKWITAFRMLKVPKYALACSKHFNETDFKKSDIYKSKGITRRLKLQATPTRNLPKTSCTRSPSAITKLQRKLRTERYNKRSWAVNLSDKFVSSMVIIDHSSLQTTSDTSAGDETHSESKPLPTEPSWAVNLSDTFITSMVINENASRQTTSDPLAGNETHSESKPLPTEPKLPERIIKSEDNSEPLMHQQRPKTMMRNQCYDVMVKVDADVYYLNKLQLALKSDYFEKLLIEYSDQKECNLIQLPVMDTDTFATIVDIMHGKKLKSVLNHDNHVDLLMAMDYLQMEIDFKTYAHFIRDKSMPDAKLFILYNFIRDNPNMQSLIAPILKHMSNHFTDLRNNKEFLSLSLDHFTTVLKQNRTDRELKGHSHHLRETCQIYAEWVHYDLRSRLHYVEQLPNVIKRKHHLGHFEDAYFNVRLPQITEHVTPEILAKLFHKVLVFNGEINPAGYELLKGENQKENIPVDSRRTEQEKMKKFVENNYFYDIEVKVEEKIYKLHRYMLNSASGYFNEIFSKQTDVQYAEIPTLQPIKIYKYTLHGVDLTTFDMVVKYIYFNELRINFENVTPLLKAASKLKIEKLLQECVSWMRENIAEVCSKIFFIDGYECISRSWIKENIETVCSDISTELVIGNTLSIYSISFDTLEDLLVLSPVCCENPLQILEVCSKWVMHDVKNRYHLIPRIALAINHNFMIDHDYYKIEDIDFDNLSEESVRDKLWNFTSSTSLVAFASAINMLQKDEKKNVHEIPVFLAWTGDATIRIQNSNLDQIASFRFETFVRDFNTRPGVHWIYLAATLISDHLFIMLTVRRFHRAFYLYNIPSGKLITLNCSINSTSKDLSLWKRYSLLNCRGQIYWCFKLGHVFKYSMELNRWIIFSPKPESVDETNKRVWFTSDGTELYRMYQNSDPEIQWYVMEEFDFQENVWRLKPTFRLVQTTSESDVPIDLTVTSGNKLTVIFPSYFVLFDQCTGKLNRISSLTDNTQTRESIRNTPFALTRYQGKFLHLLGNKLYQRSDQDPSWQLKKELPPRSDVLPWPSAPSYAYQYIAAVHVIE